MGRNQWKVNDIGPIQPGSGDPAQRCDRPDSNPFSGARTIFPALGITRHIYVIFGSRDKIASVRSNYLPAPVVLRAAVATLAPVVPDSARKKLSANGIATIIGVVILIVGGYFAVHALIASAGTSGGQNNPISNAPTGTAQPIVGKPVQDGVFEYIVTGTETGAKTLSENGISKQARGVFTVIVVRVKNISKDKHSFSPSNQVVFDSQNRQHEADFTTSFSNTYVDIEPGAEITARLVFDMAPDTVAKRIELHDSMFSFGTKVDFN
ncbi:MULTISPECIES: DUF4352 domain-containing protein [unclassified Nocardia]|uniref:DUF4352 domain-containing protein n=1 Tax=unclassified Nocardia TaxID=2637762 RepID=UPI001CE3DF09|nr:MULTISPECIES: DUF4352 domain-containing protein [unclassified Nocardia]